MNDLSEEQKDSINEALSAFFDHGYLHVLQDKTITVDGDFTLTELEALVIKLKGLLNVVF